MISEMRLTFGIATPMRVEFAPQRRQIALRDMRQHQVLLVADTDFAERIAVGEIGDALPSARRWRRPACRLPA